MWRLLTAYTNLFFITFIGGLLPLRVPYRLQTTDYPLRVPTPNIPLRVPYRLQTTDYPLRVPYRTEGEKFKSLHGYVLSLSKDKQDVAIYVLNKTLKTFDLSKLKVLYIKMFHMKHSLSPNCMRAIFRLEEIKFPSKKNLLISQAVYQCFI